MLRPVIKIEGVEEISKRLEEGVIARPMRSTMNLLAGNLGQAMDKSLDQNFTRVNRYTKNSLFSYGVKPGTPIKKMNVYAGSLSPYLAELEGGFNPKPFGLKASIKGQETTTDARWIASKSSRKSDGAVKPGFRISRMSDIFLMKVQGEQIAFKREGNKIKRVRIKKESVKAVKAYKWLAEAIAKVYSPSWIEDTFARLFASGEGFEMGKPPARRG